MATLMISLGISVFRSRHVPPQPSPPQRIFISFRWIDRWPTKSRRARKFRFFFPTDRDPALNDLATCWMRNGEWLLVVKWFGRARGREHGGGGGPHLLQSSNGKVIEQVVAPHRGQRQIRFHRNPPSPHSPIIATSTAIHRSKLTYYTSAISPDTNTHSRANIPIAIFRSRNWLQLHKFFDKNGSLLNLSWISCFFFRNKHGKLLKWNK